MPTIDFLEARVPLSKEFSYQNKKLSTRSYPTVSLFKSHRITITTIADLFAALKKHSLAGHCILKGRLSEALDWARRAGTTKAEDTTEWMCLDLDNAPYKAPEEFMGAHPLLKDVSYVVQYSASQGLQHKKGLSCHIFFLLTHPYHAQYIKAWLMEQNLNGTLLDGHIKQAVTLNPAGNTLHYPIDITACQNDKLIFIAPPTVGPGVIFTIKPTELIQLVPKALPALPIERLKCDAMDRWLKEAKNYLNLLREAAKLPALRLRKQWIDGVEVTKGVGTFTITETWEDEDFVRFNFNGGDSGAYWHPKNNFELIGDFKTDERYSTKEVLPDYYKRKIAERKEQSRTPVDGETYILGVCDKRTGRYLKIAWIPAQHRLELYPADSVTQLTDWLMSHGIYGQDYVPQWNIEFNPQSTQIMDVENNYMNTFVQSRWLREATPDIKGLNKAPIIKRIIAHAATAGIWNEITDHFINWLAVIFQHRVKTRTAWVLHGTEGCLAGDTSIYFRRGKRNGGRPLTIEKAFQKWTGTFQQGTGRGKTWNLAIPTYARAVKNEYTVGYHEVYRIVQTGVKQLYKLTTEYGHTIRVTAEHPFMREDGSFTKLNRLKQGDTILLRGIKNKHAEIKGRKQRETTYSIQHHPHAGLHTVNGKNYKRMHKARLVYEAAMNNLSLQEFLRILRNDEQKALQLTYLSNDDIVHHLDENPANDALDNLVLVDKKNHDKFHAKSTGLGTVPVIPAVILSIEKDKMEMTYDMTMKAPYHNYVANNFCVSNTGKGLLFNKVIKPLLGREYCHEIIQRRLEDQFNGWMERALFVFVDEAEIGVSMQKAMISGELRNWITEDDVNIRFMQKTAVMIPNSTNFMFGSNKQGIVEINNRDRRYNIGEKQPVKLEITDKEVNSIEQELPHFLNYLMAYKADKERAGKIIHTSARREVIEANQNSIEQLCEAVLEGNIAPFLMSLPDMKLIAELHGAGHESAVASQYDTIVRREMRLMQHAATPGKNGVQRVESRLSRDELWVLLEHNCGNIPHSPSKFTRLLAHKNIKTKRVRIKDELAYGVDVIWTFSSEWLKQNKLDEKPVPSSKLQRIK